MNTHHFFLPLKLVVLLLSWMQLLSLKTDIVLKGRHVWGPICDAYRSKVKVTEL